MPSTNSIVCRFSICILFCMTFHGASCHPVDSEVYTSYGSLAESGDGADDTVLVDQLIPLNPSPRELSQGQRLATGTRTHQGQGRNVRQGSDRARPEERPVVQPTNLVKSASTQTIVERTRTTSGGEKPTLPTWPTGPTDAKGTLDELGQDLSSRSSLSEVMPTLLPPTLADGRVEESSFSAPEFSKSDHAEAPKDEADDTESSSARPSEAEADDTQSSSATPSEAEADGTQSSSAKPSESEADDNEFDGKREQSSSLSWLFGLFGSSAVPEEEEEDPEEGNLVSDLDPQNNIKDGDEIRRDSPGDGFHTEWYDRRGEQEGLYVYDHNFIDYSRDDYGADFDLFADYDDILEDDDKEIDRKESSNYDAADAHEGLEKGVAENAIPWFGTPEKVKEEVDPEDTKDELNKDSEDEGKDGKSQLLDGEDMDESTMLMGNKTDDTVGSFATEEEGSGLIDEGSGSVTSWSEWSQCSATCGYGRRERTRLCGSDCTYNMETEECLMKSCFGILDIFPELNDKEITESPQVSDTCEQWLQCKDEFVLNQVKRLYELPTCPCYYPIGLDHDNKIWDPANLSFFSWIDASGAEENLKTFKSGAANCIRSLLVPNSGVFASQHCCYDDWMQLITQGQGAGTPNLVSPELSPLLHYKIDVLPWIICKGDWTRYNKVRPPNNGQSCLQNPENWEYQEQVEELKKNL